MCLACRSRQRSGAQSSSAGTARHRYLVVILPLGGQTQGYITRNEFTGHCLLYRAELKIESDPPLYSGETQRGGIMSVVNVDDDEGRAGAVKENCVPESVPSDRLHDVPIAAPTQLSKEIRETLHGSRPSSQKFQVLVGVRLPHRFYEAGIINFDLLHGNGTKENSRFPPIHWQGLPIRVQ
ncbi:hypothetical protein EDB83DRAFT_2316972 [Lactarius deliciosus]|nr:hypothetical protein EDB83DRAFT_2316972 [Lactarius deliciosus]